MSFSNDTLKAKLTSIRMMKIRGYSLTEDEEDLLDLSFEAVLEYFQSKTHLTTSKKEVRVYHNPIQAKKKLILSPGERADNEDEYTNVPNFIYNSVNVAHSDLRNTLSNLYYHPIQKEWCLVYFSSDREGKNFGDSEFRSITNIAELCHIYNLIIIAKGKPTPAAKAKIPELRRLKKVTVLEQHRHVQYFEENELLFCIIEHTYCPKYRLSSEQELYEAYYPFPIKISKIPSITVGDKIIKFYGWKIGDIVIEESFFPFVSSLVQGEITFKRIIPSGKEKKTKK